MRSADSHDSLIRFLHGAAAGGAPGGDRRDAATSDGTVARHDIINLTINSHGCGNTSTDEWKYATRPTRDSSPPTASTATVLLTHYAYNADTGLLEGVTDPKDVITKTFYDDLGRKTYVAENWWNFYPDTGGAGTGSTDKSQDKVTQFVYNGLGQLKQLVALDRNGDGTTDDNETTTYLYADTYDASLVTKTTYPDGGDVDVTYNLDGLVATRTDQREVTLTYTYDSQRRLSVQGATTVPGGVDTSILSIKREYDSIGRLEKVTSYSAANGSGTVRNQVQFAYDDLDRKTAIYQSHEGEVNTSTTLKTQIAYDDSVTSNVFNDAGRLSYYTYPDGATQIAYYPGESSDVNDRLNRVVYVKQNSVTKAQYLYAGLGLPVYIEYDEPELSLFYLSETSPLSVYSGYDRFGRIRDQWWRDTGSSTTVVEIGHGYDYAGNRTYREDIKAASLSPAVDIDEYYTYDNLHRLTNLDRGALNEGKTAISGTPVREEDWTLDALGNWAALVQKTSGSTNLNQTRTHNAANEITAIDSSDDDVAHDAAGNMTRVPSLDADWADHYHMIYDAWNRLVEVQDATESYDITKIEYNGLNQRIVKTSYADSESQPATVYLYYNDRWQCVEERPDDGEGWPTSYPKYRYVWGPRYIDELIYRDQCNPTTGALVQRLYAMQDANWNVVALAEEDGDVVERYLYDAYGRATVLDPAFTADADNASDYAWTHLYTGRQLDSETGLMDYRNRCYHTGLGRFVTRDPVGYLADDGNLYRYCLDSPLHLYDPLGLAPPNPYPPQTEAGDRLKKLCTSQCMAKAGNECTVERCMTEAATIGYMYTRMFKVEETIEPCRWIRLIFGKADDYRHGWLCYQWQTYTYTWLKRTINESKCFYQARVGHYNAASGELQHNWVAITVGATPTETGVPRAKSTCRSGPCTAWADPWTGGGATIYLFDQNTGLYDRPSMNTPGSANFLVDEDFVATQEDPDHPGVPVFGSEGRPTGTAGYYFTNTGVFFRPFEGAWSWPWFWRP